jgi:hypothetical protein
MLKIPTFSFHLGSKPALLRNTYTGDTTPLQKCSKTRDSKMAPIEVIVLVTLTTLTFGWRKCLKNSHQNNSSISLSLSHTHTISKSVDCQPKLTNVYQLDEEKTDLKKSRAFELEWVIQIQFISQ